MEDSQGIAPSPPATPSIPPAVLAPSTAVSVPGTTPAAPGPTDGINPDTAALLTAAAAHGRQDAVQLPRDAKLVSLILQAMGVEEYEPRVVPQILEFVHRYVLDVLGDAQTYADHASHNHINMDDIRLAIEGRASHSFTTPPGREFLDALAAKRNTVPLPIIPEKFGVRLPPERHTLTGTNFQIAINKPEPPSATDEPSHQSPPAETSAMDNSQASLSQSSMMVDSSTTETSLPPFQPTPVKTEMDVDDNYDED